MLLSISTFTLLMALAPSTLLAAPTRTTHRTDSLVDIFPRGALSTNLTSQLSYTKPLCNLSNITLPTAPTPLPPITPGLTLRHIALGRGTQNYSCASSSSTQAPKPLGALATLFNATCDAARLPAPLFAHITRLALAYAIPTGALANRHTCGHHEFTAQGVPLFRFVAHEKDHDYAHAHAHANTTAANTTATTTSSSTSSPASAPDSGYVLAKAEPAKSAAPAGAALGANGFGSVPWIKLDGLEGAYKEVYRVQTAGGMAPANCSGAVAGTVFTVEYSAQYWFYA